VEPPEKKQKLAKCQVHEQSHYDDSRSMMMTRNDSVSRDAVGQVFFSESSDN